MVGQEEIEEAGRGGGGIGVEEDRTMPNGLAETQQEMVITCRSGFVEEQAASQQQPLLVEENGQHQQQQQRIVASGDCGGGGGLTMMESDEIDPAMLQASPATSSNRRLLITSPKSRLSTPKKLANRIFHKRQRSPSSSPSPSPNLHRRTTGSSSIANRTPSASSFTNASNSACILDEDDANGGGTTRCFCAFPICMNFLDDAAKMIRRSIENNQDLTPVVDKEAGGGGEQQKLGNATAKLSLVGEGASGSSLRSRKENLPPNLMHLLKTAENEALFSSTEDDYNEADMAPNFLRIDRKKAQVQPQPTAAAPNGSSTSVTQQSIFRPSRFSNVPPTIRFHLPDEKGIVEKPKKNVRRMLKWCYNSLVPKVVRKVLYASHFQIVSEDSYWIGYWGRHLRTQDFRNVLPYQKINHFPGTFHLGRKDRLWMNIRKMMTKWREGDFAAVMPRTFVLPKDAKSLKALMKGTGQIVPFILKPPASARGSGIRVVHRWAQVPRKEPLIAQVYIDRPYLISGSKFDLRLYVYVSSFSPLRIYLYEDGLVRFASIKYSSNLATLGNRLMHLTNYSLNKNANVDDPNRSVTGQKWSVRELWRFLAQNGHDVGKLMDRIVDLILKAFVSCESPINSFIRRHLTYPFACHELFGIDIVLDEELTPWLLEINISPSLHTSTDLDMDVKSGLAKDVLNLAGIHLPDRQQVHEASPRLSLDLSQPSTVQNLDLRTKQNDNHLSDDERTKQAFFLRKYAEASKTDASILENLTPSDVRVLIETEDEYDRRDQFARIFPSPFSTRYLKYFENPKYYNLLLEEWIGQYAHIRETGCSLLETYCKAGYHLARNPYKYD